MKSHTRNSPLSIELWYCRLSDTSKAHESTIKSLLSVTEKQRFEATSNHNKKREFLISRALMRHALSQQFKIPESEWQFVSKPNSPPTITNLPKGVYISLSHRKGLICFAIASAPIGLDLECLLTERNYAAISPLIMGDDELKAMSPNKVDQASYFYRVWCAKEAYYKAIPRKKQSETSLKYISVPSLMSDMKPWFLYEGNNQQFQLSLVVKNKPEKIKYNQYPTSSNELLLTLSLSEKFLP